MIQAPNPRAHAAPQVGRAARFFLDGVDVPVTARVDRVDARGMTLRQELPFLKLHRSLRDDRGRNAELISVGVAVRDGTPSLVLELRYGRRRREPTVPFSTGRLTNHDPQIHEADMHRTELDTMLDWNGEALRGDAPATPLPPLSVPTPKPAWHTILWIRLRAFFASL